MSSSSDYTSKLAGSLNDLRKQGLLCDVTIKVAGRSFPSHKNILAASSSYFMAMFTHGFKENAESEITIDGKPEIFEVLLEYTYTGDLRILQSWHIIFLRWLAIYSLQTSISAALISSIFMKHLHSKR